MAQTYKELLKSRRIIDGDHEHRAVRMFKCPTTHVKGGEGGWVVDSGASAPAFPAIGDAYDSGVDSTLTNVAFSSASAPKVVSITHDPRSTRKTAIFRVDYHGLKIWE